MRQIRLWALGGMTLVGLGAASILGQTGGTRPTVDADPRLPASPVAPRLTNRPGFPTGDPLPATAPPSASSPIPAPAPVPALVPMAPAAEPFPTFSSAPTPAPMPVNSVSERPTNPTAFVPVAANPKAESTPEKVSEPVLNVDGRPGRQEPSVSIEWIGPQSARLNQPIPFQVLVRNTCAFPVHDVVVRHRLPQGVTCKGSDPVAATEKDELTWKLGSLPAGQVRRIDLQLLSQARGALNCQATVTFAGASYHQVVVREPQLVLKMRAPETVLMGETVTLLFALSNPGDGASEAVKLKVALPEGLEHQRGRVVDVDIGNLAPKEIRTMQMVCIARGSGAQKCSVTASSDGISSTDTAVVQVLLPKLDLVMNGPKLRYIDRRASYTLKVANPGSAPAANVAINEVLPAGFKYHSASGGGHFDEATRTVSWKLGDLLPGQSREVTVDLIPTASGDHRLTAQVTTARGLKTEAEVQTRVEGLSALAIEIVDTDDPVEVSGDTAYEIRISNAGTKMETNVEVACTLPEQVEFRAAKAGANLRFRVEGRDVIFEPLAKLAPRADVIYRLQVRAKTAGDARFRTRVRADGLTEPVIREESTRIYNDNALAK